MIAAQHNNWLQRKALHAAAEPDSYTDKHACTFEFGNAFSGGAFMFMRFITLMTALGACFGEVIGCECAPEEPNPYFQIIPKSDAILEGVVEKVVSDSNLLFVGILKVTKVHKSSKPINIGDHIKVASGMETDCGYSFNTSVVSILFLNYKTRNGLSMLSTSDCARNIENTSQQVLMEKFYAAMKKLVKNEKTKRIVQ